MASPSTDKYTLEIPVLLTSDAEIKISISNRFLYARTSTLHAGYVIQGLKLSCISSGNIVAIPNFVNSVLIDDHVTKSLAAYQIKLDSGNG